MLRDALGRRGGIKKLLPGLALLRQHPARLTSPSCHIIDSKRRPLVRPLRHPEAASPLHL